MFDNLLETRRKRERGAGGYLMSVVLHVTVIGLAVAATANAGIQAAKEIREEKVNLMEVKKPPPPETKPPPPDVVHTPPPPKGFQILTAPVEIPDVLPKIDLSKKMTDEADFTGKGAVGGTSKGVEGGVAKPLNETALYEFQVEKVAAAIAGVGIPVYPEALKAAGIEGEVQATFVIDTTGHALTATFKVLKATNKQFEDAVRTALPKMRFLPAEVGGHKVMQHVQQAFQFSVK
jgi:protein TonB